MTNEAELAVKAHIWTVDQVGTLDSFLSTWIWLPYRVKEALAMSIKGGLLSCFGGGVPSVSGPTGRQPV